MRVFNVKRNTIKIGLLKDNSSETKSAQFLKGAEYK